MEHYETFDFQSACEYAKPLIDMGHKVQMWCDKRGVYNVYVSVYFI